MDSPVVWSKQHDEDGQNGTHSVLALIQNETAATAFPWPLYIQLTTAHQMGDAVGAYVRLNKTGTSVKWTDVRTHTHTHTHTHTLFSFSS